MKKFAYGLLAGWLVRGVTETIALYSTDYSKLASKKRKLEDAAKDIETGFKGLVNGD